jgi:hypothetical protein
VGGCAREGGRGGVIAPFAAQPIANPTTAARIQLTWCFMA